MNYVELFEILHSGHLCVCVFSRIFCPLFLHLDKGVWVSAPIRCYLPTMSHVPATMSMCWILMCQHQQYLWSTCTTKTTWWIYSEHISKQWFWQGQYVCSMTFPEEILSFPTWNNGKKSVKSMVSVNLQVTWWNDDHLTDGGCPRWTVASYETKKNGWMGASFPKKRMLKQLIVGSKMIQVSLKVLVGNMWFLYARIRSWQFFWGGALPKF